MYRSNATNEIVYSPEDLVLFRESPFASWMERLTLENPEHGIQPDTLPQTSKCADLRSADGRGSSLGWQEFVDGLASQPQPAREPSGDLVALLQESEDVVVVHRHASEAERRKMTSRAMRAGPRYIADAQLAVGSLACRVDLLVRCDGVSELGDYLYVPGATRAQNTPHTSLSLCFAADLLKSLQGVEPTELLIMRAGQDITCLDSRDHMPRFNDLKYEFMSAQLSFRKHRVPDPAASSHHGRWSRCARELMAQRASVRESRTRLEAARQTQADRTDQAVQRTEAAAPERGGLALAMMRALSHASSGPPARDVNKHDTPDVDYALPAIRRQGTSG